MKIIGLLLFLSVNSYCQDVPFYNRGVDKKQDIGAINQNFRDLADRKDVLSQGEVPDEYQKCIFGDMFCVNQYDKKINIGSNGITFQDGTTQTTAVSPYPIGPTYYVIKTIAQDASFLLQVDNDGALLMSTTETTTLTPWLFMTGYGKTWRISAASDGAVQTDLLGFVLSGGKIPLISANGTLYMVSVDQDNALSTTYMGAL